MELLYNNTYYKVDENQLFEDSAENNFESDTKNFKEKIDNFLNAKEIKDKSTEKAFLDRIKQIISKNDNKQNNSNNGSYNVMLNAALKTCDDIQREFQKIVFDEKKLKADA